MLFLRDRVAREKLQAIWENQTRVEEYAKDYQERFADIAKSQGALYSCS